MSQKPEEIFVGSSSDSDAAAKRPKVQEPSQLPAPSKKKRKKKKRRQPPVKDESSSDDPPLIPRRPAKGKRKSSQKRRQPKGKTPDTASVDGSAAFGKKVAAFEKEQKDFQAEWRYLEELRTALEQERAAFEQQTRAADHTRGRVAALEKEIGTLQLQLQARNMVGEAQQQSAQTVIELLKERLEASEKRLERVTRENMQLQLEKSSSSRSSVEMQELFDSRLGALKGTLSRIERNTTPSPHVMSGIPSPDASRPRPHSYWAAKGPPSSHTPGKTVSPFPAPDKWFRLQQDRLRQLSDLPQTGVIRVDSHEEFFPGEASDEEFYNE